MNELVPLALAKRHLRISAYSEDGDLQMKLDQAHATIENYVDQRLSDAAAWTATVDAWTEDTAPKQLIAAILLQFGAMVRFRGDDDDIRGGFDENGLAPGVAGLLRRLRDPALA